jgi:hypothetical protein
MKSFTMHWTSNLDGDKICPCYRVTEKKTDVKLGGIIFWRKMPTQMFCMKMDF